MTWQQSTQEGESAGGRAGGHALPAALGSLWQEALAFWDSSVALRRPLAIGGDDVAFIDLTTRQTHVNFEKLEELGLNDRLACVLTHEVGHHIRYPHTLVAMRKLQIFLRRELANLLLSWPGEATAARRRIDPARVRTGDFDFLLNLFLDVLINNDMVLESREARPAGAGDFLDDFVVLYQRLVTETEARKGRVMAFYLAVYEALWYLPRATLVNTTMGRALGAISRHWRADAADLAQFLENHPGRRYLQLARFILAFVPYLLADGRPLGAGVSLEGARGIGGDLSPDELRRLLGEDADIREARRWLRGARSSGAEGRDVAPGAGDDDSDDGQRERGFPARGLLDSLEGLAEPSEVVLGWYRTTAARVDYRLPGSFRQEDSLVPGPPALWEPGDALQGIDWLATFARSGVAVPGMTTLQRTYLPGEPVRGDTIRPWIEIYVDSSGSMPNPVAAPNSQVLAGFALVRVATEAGGRVRVIQYSGQGAMRAMPDFTASAEPAYRALLEYIGGGTAFPFGEVRKSVARWRRRAQMYRVVLSDSDFLANVFRPWKGTAEAALQSLSLAAQEGDRIIALLAARAAKTEREELAKAGVEVIEVTDQRQLFEVAGELGRRLFPPDGATRRGAHP